MTPAEHYAQAEQNLEMAKTSASGSVEETYFLGLAHVHATLATCASESAYPAVLHVMPVGDHVEHTSDLECPCGPEARSINRDDGTTGTLFVHHSLDGREIAE